MSRRKMVRVRKTTGKQRTQFEPGNKVGNRFKKGNKEAVGKGRPKRIPSLDALLDDVLGTDSPDDSKSAMHKIIVALTKRAQYGDAKAATLLMDRKWGRAPQSIDITTKGDKIETVAPLINVYNTAPPLADGEASIDTPDKPEPKKLKK